jgi:hypothetical protein
MRLAHQLAALAAAAAGGFHADLHMPGRSAVDALLLPLLAVRRLRAALDR